DVLRAAFLLDPVPVDERGEAVEAVLGCRHGGLPRLPDVLLAVAEDAVGPPGLVVHPSREGEADGEGETLALRPRGVLDAGRRTELRMALDAAAQLAERHELLDREEPALREGRVPDRAGVALAQDEPVAIGPGRIRRIRSEERRVGKTGDTRRG